MPKIVDHEQRKQEITTQALKLFLQIGYKNTRLSRVAESCGIARTTLYKYFKNKDEVLHYAIDRVFDVIERGYRTLPDQENLSAREKILALTRQILSGCVEELDLLSSIVDFWFHFRKEQRVLRIIVWRRFNFIQKKYYTHVTDAIQSGEFRQADPANTTRLILAIVESQVIHICLMAHMDVETGVEVIRLFLDRLQTSEKDTL